MCLTNLAGGTTAGTAVNTSPWGMTGAGRQAFRYDFATEKFTDVASPTPRLESWNNGVDLWTDYASSALRTGGPTSR